MQKMKMFYGRYKQHYSDCETLHDYDKVSKTITVLVPDDRIKKSGTRGRAYTYFRFPGIEIATGRHIEVPIKAVSLETAKKQCRKYYPDCEFDYSAYAV